MFSQPQPQHQIFEKLVGNWNVSTKCSMGPDQPAAEFKGTSVGRMMGGLWLLLEGSGTGPDGVEGEHLFTLGYDPAKNGYVGSFICSVMDHLWLYDGTYDEASRKLILNSEGPKMDQSGGLAHYRDAFEFVSEDHCILTSHMLGEDDQWHQFMTADYHRA